MGLSIVLKKIASIALQARHTPSWGRVTISCAFPYPAGKITALDTGW
jgi:hypothetical protein